jgi:KDO2-lipid IV(A) lauroyltransferase
MRHRLEYAPVWLILQTLRFLPRPLARGIGIGLGMLVYLLHWRLRRVGTRNLELCFPDMPTSERKRILRGVFASIGRQLAEVPKFPDYTRENVSRIADYVGLENFLEAERLGKGVLFLTAHIGGWEIGSLAHSVYGHPLHAVMRPLDNPYLDRLTRRLRTCHGNWVIDKDEFARGVLGALRRGETVGVLMDTNMTPPEGIFVDFFGRAACTSSSIARLAIKTGAAVVPAFTVWDRRAGKYHIEFEPAVAPVLTGDLDADIAATTSEYNRVLERVITRYPEQWLWVHRRWKTRPAGETPLY